MSHVIKYFLQIKYKRVPKKKNHAPALGCISLVNKIKINSRREREKV